MYNSNRHFQQKDKFLETFPFSTQKSGEIDNFNSKLNIQNKF